MYKLHAFTFLFLLTCSAWAQCGPNQDMVSLSVTPTSNAENLYWTLTNSDGEVFDFDFALDNATANQNDFCLPYGAYNLSFSTMNGAAWTGSYSLVNTNTGNNVLTGTGSSSSALFSMMPPGDFPCQTFTGAMTYALPPVAGTTPFVAGENPDTLFICLDVALNINFDFPENNTDYEQTQANTTVEWEVNNVAGVHHGEVHSGAQVTFDLTDPVLYEIIMTATDWNGCDYVQSFYIRNTSPNTYVDVWSDEDTICVDEIVEIHTSHFNTSFPLTISEPNPVFLDDVNNGSGQNAAEYVSTISIGSFTEADTLTADCITRVCASMEHSFVGDLTIYMELPDGNIIDFLPDLNGTGVGNGFGLVYMGEPNDGDAANPTPGTPYRYCWSPAVPSTQTMHALATSVGGTFPETVINGDGTYTNGYAVNADNGNGWDNQIGSSINGDWSIHIIDSWGSDNGYIFGWDFELCVSPDVVYVDSFWVADPTEAFVAPNQASFTDRDVIGVVATNNTMEFEYHILDNYGCEWEGTHSIVTWANPVAEDDAIVFCDSTYQLGVADPNAENFGSWSYTAPPGGPSNVQFSPNTTVANPTITVPELGTYEFVYTSACGSQDVQTVEFVSQPPSLNIVSDVQCNFNIQLEATNPIQDGAWTAEGPSGASINITDPFGPTTSVLVDDYGLYTFTYTYAFCEASFSHDVLVESVAPIISTPEDDILCDKFIQLNATVPGHVDHWEASGPGIVSFDDFQSANTEAQVTAFGAYTFYFYACGGVDSIEVNFVQEAPQVFAPTFVECGTEAFVTSTYSGSAAGSWSVEAGTNEDITLTDLGNNTVSLETDIYGEAYVTYTVCDTSTTVLVVFMCDLVIPNVFTPNQTQDNQSFYIKRLETTYYDKSVLKVYNRWGKLVYTNGAYGLTGSWWEGKDSKSGTDLPEGEYFYDLQVHNKVNDQTESYKGTVHIFR
ncbi:MAG: gliding motility-associated C-terminal domain-containing protein [Flavobacteriales bacterium]